MSVWCRNYSFDSRQCGPAGAASWSKDGSPFNATPQLQRNDAIQLSVTWGTGNPPASLTAYVIIGANQQGNNPGTDVSPFGSQSQPTVFASQTTGVISGSSHTFNNLGLNNARVPASGTASMS
jgi:hypothetical protein